MADAALEVDDAGILFVQGKPVARLDWGYNVPEERQKLRDALAPFTYILVPLGAVGSTAAAAP